MLEGLIESFDVERGDGVFVDDGGVRFYFHCVNIGDGSRSIDVGVRATGRRAVGRLGRDEISEVAAIAE